MASVTERVDSLEETLRAFIVGVGEAQRQTEAELRDFKDEMRDFKDEMQAFKDEMQSFKEEGRRENREMNRRWGEIANRLGTVVEDLVGPKPLAHHTRCPWPGNHSSLATAQAQAARRPAV